MRRLRLFLCGAVALAMITGCASVNGSQSLRAPSTREAPPLSFPGPVLDANFADPFVMPVKDGFLALATNSDGVSIQVARSTDLVHWRLESVDPDGSGPPLDAMPVLPAWVRPAEAGRPDIWAPEAARIGGRYVLYFSARHNKARRPDGDNRECIGAAVSDQPEGGYRPAREPLVCAEFEEGVIDPSPFQDGGRLYLYYKSDGNCCGRQTRLYVQALAADGLSLIGGPRELGVANDQAWEGDVVEAPTMVKHDGRYTLFFSGSDFGGAGYAVGYAACRGPIGPCVQALDNPLLKSGSPTTAAKRVGPGHQSVFEGFGRHFMAYHAWSRGPGGVQGDRRRLYISELRWAGERPELVTAEPASVTSPQPQF